MADVTHLNLPLTHLGPYSGAPAFNAFALDANNDAVGFVFQAQDANAITHVGVRYGSRTGTPPTYRISIQGVDGSGFPDGTPKGGGSPASVSFTPPADATWNSTFRWFTLDNSYTPTVGEVLAIAVEYSSGTVDGSNNSTVVDGASNVKFGSNWGLPYPLRKTAGTWAASSTCPIFGVQTASTRYGYPAANNSSQSDSTTLGHRQAAAFTLPTALGTSFKVRGFRWIGKSGSAAQTFKAGIWDTSSVLQDVTLDTDHTPSSNTSTQSREVIFDESSLATLLTGVEYYIGAEVLVGTSPVFLRGVELSEADDGLAYPFGTAVCYAEYNGTSWTKTTTRRPWVELIITDIVPRSGGNYQLGVV